MIKKNPQDTIVAKVNAEELYESQLEGAVDNYRASLKEQGIDVRVFGKDQLNNVRQFMLAKLVERELLHQEAVRQKIKVTSKEIDQALEESEKGYASHQEFLNDILKDGASLETYKERLAYDMIINKLVAKRYEQRKKAFSAKEISSFYRNNTRLFAQPESVNIGQILIKLPPDAEDEEIEKARETLRKIRGQNADFRELAKKYSECDSSAQGGDLGFHSRGQLYPPLEAAVGKLKENEISQPVVTREGVHLIKLYERRPKGYIPPFEEIKGQVEQVMKIDQAQKIYQDYVDELKQTAHIEVFLS
jgi:parvulin-like peptidyl-prolyl isomerase